MPFPDEIDATFLARPDVFAMDASTLGVGGDINRWPDEVMRPQVNGIKYVLFDHGDPVSGSVDYRNRTDAVRPAGSLYPEEGGTIGDPVYWISYDAQQAASSVFRVNLDHPQNRTNKSLFNIVDLSDPGATGLAASYIEMHGLSFKNQLNLHSTGCRVDSCDWDEVDIPGNNCIRFRFDATDNVVENCFFRRSPPFSTTEDIICIVFGQEGVNVNNSIIGNVILNYTDQIQTLDRNDLTTESCPGLLISYNVMGFTSDTYTLQGSMLQGLENVLDFKTGGTVAKPVIIENNIIFGTRENSGTPGYSVVFQRLAENFEITNNIFSDNSAGIFLNGQFVDNDSGNAWVTPKIKLNGNTFFKIKRNGVTLFPGVAGRVFVGSNIVDEFKDNIFLECQFIFERVADPRANKPWPFDTFRSNAAHEPFDGGAVVWPERTIDSPGSSEVYISEVTKITIPFTNIKIIVDLETNTTPHVVLL